MALPLASVSVTAAAIARSFSGFWSDKIGAPGWCDCIATLRTSLLDGLGLVCILWHRA
jgi:hypothetical protein